MKVLSQIHPSIGTIPLLLVKPFSHQVECFRHAMENGRTLNLSEVGTGKTLPSIMAAEARLSRKEVRRVLIVCPLSVISNWKDEIKKAIGKDAICLIGSRKKRATLLKRKAQYFIINFEGIRIIQKEIMASRIGMLIVDEIHRLKNPRSKQSKACYQIGDRTSFRLGLTGTPILNHPMDLFGIYRLIDPSVFGQSFWTFRAKYFIDANAGKSWATWPEWQLKKGTKASLSEKIYSKAIRYLKNECLDLPPLLFETRKVQMGREQRGHYEEMKRNYLTQVGEKTVVAQIILTKLMKLAQITSGWAKDAEGKVVHVTEASSNPKIRVLKELRDEIGTGERLVVWCHFRHDIELVANVLDTKLIIHGGVPPVQREVTLKWFKETPGSVLVAQPGAGGEGINLAEARYAVYFSRGYSLKDREQSLGRTHRHGSECHDKVTVIDIVAEDSIDELILQALMDKEDLARTIVDRLKEV